MGKKDRRAEIPDKKARKNAEKAKEEEKERKEVPKISGCHVSIDVCGGCIRPKDPIPEADSQDGVKMACSNHHCPFAITHSVHKDCFQKLTDKVVSMLLRTGSSSWTDEQRVENAWRKKGLTFVGKFISCPCGHGTQTLEDSENRWSRIGEVVLDPATYEKKREEKIKKALKQDKPAPTQPKTLNCSFGGRAQAVLERKLARMEYEEDGKFARGDSASFPSEAKKTKRSPAAAAPTMAAFVSPPQPQPQPPMDDDGFTTIGRDGRARELAMSTPSPPGAAAAGATLDRKGIQPLRSLVVSPPSNYPFPSMVTNRAERGRTISSSSNTSWLTSSTLPQQQQQQKQHSNTNTLERRGKRGGKKEAERLKNKENRARSTSTAAGKKSGFALLSGSEDEEEEEEREEAWADQPSMKSLRDFAEEFHQYSGIGLWSASEVKELNQHLALLSDSALFQCRVTGRKLRDPTLLTELNPKSAWVFTTQAMALKKADIPPGTQLTLQEYYAIFHNHEVMHLDDPIIWCRDGTLAILEYVDLTMLTTGK